MSLRDCLNTLKDPIEEKIALLKKDLSDAQLDTNPWSGLLTNTIAPLLTDTVMGILGDVANEWVETLMARANSQIADTLGNLYGAASMVS